jgi:4'-phosphopantetheinyl transferase
VEQIDSGQVHVWLADLNEITDPQLLQEYRRLLTREEQQRQQRFHFARDRHQYLVTRAMVRAVLSKYSLVAPRDWRFVVNPYGRPSIGARHFSARGIQFNVSHTEGLVIMGITRGRAVGVDVENVRPQNEALEVANHFFAPEEVAALRALSEAEQQQRFFEYWTLKEAYIKARGLGLSIPLDSFWFEFSADSRVQLRVSRRALDDRADMWVFWQLRPLSCYRAAICVQGADTTLRIITRRIVPLLSDEPFKP